MNLKTKGQHDVIRALGELKKRGDTNYEYQLVGLGDESFLRSIAKNTMLRMKWFFWVEKRMMKFFNGWII